MRILRIIAVTGSLAIALMLIVLALNNPAIAAEDSFVGLQENRLASTSLDSDNAVVQSGITSVTLSCREGLAGAEPYLSTGINIQSLGGGTYLDYWAHPPASQPSAMEFIQVIRPHQTKDSLGNYLPGYTFTPALSDAAGGLGPIIASAPGSLWLIGNEPDRGPDKLNGPAQGDTFPDIYARAYHDAYQFIKQRDPTALVAIAGLVEVTPGRLQYLDIVWNTYAALYHEPLPVDVWNMHLYILPEITGIANIALGTDPALAIGFAYTHTPGGPKVYTLGDHDNLNIFDEQVRQMRQWMANHGQQDKPLLMSEVGLLYDEGVTDEFGKNFTMPRAASFLTRTFDYLSNATDPNIGMPSDGNRLVQQWIWYSTNSSLGHISNLVTNTTPLAFTSVGNMFRSNVSTRLLRPNLQPRLAAAATPILMAGVSSVTATLSVQVVNNGNQGVTVPFTVTFYSDAALTHVIGSVVVTNGLPGCARRSTALSVAWPAQGAGPHSFWVKADSSSSINESNESDNIVEGQAFVSKHRAYLPLLISRSFP